MMDLFEAARATNGTAYGANVLFGGVSTDSRNIGSGELFIALRGERFDGHAYLAQARERGACAAVVAADAVDELLQKSQGQGMPLLAVADTRLALGALSAYWRARFVLPLIAVTGSNGKTSTKEMISAVLKAQAVQDGYDPQVVVLATQGNFNNDIGLPLTLLKLRTTHRSGVIEMGMNHPGEIGYLTRLAQPTVALVTNAQRAHLEGMGELQQVAEEKGTIYAGLMPGGVAVINRDDAFGAYWQSLNSRRRCVSFGLEAGAEVRGEVQSTGLGSRLRLTSPQGSAEIRLQVPGLHNARNAVAAAAATLAAGISLTAVVAGLEGYSGVKGRLQRKTGESGAVLLDDTYNANPDSVRAGIDVLAAVDGDKVLILGDMGEIGPLSTQYHEEIGAYAKSQGIGQLFALGESAQLAVRAFGAGGSHYNNIEDLLAAVRPHLTPVTTVLVKGSRFMRMERVVDALAASSQENQACC
ncbi:MAG: UDP-N-acetylmuramoyl-tripeptide--D-alanyl-D-alanine ligase [Betaproteobacteria bacterium]|nr:UDP-N-acetylmuramoyl-tripeptide--D-alanyl-D-alanine ligase [Betaproteobacteria bacterium]